MNLSPLILILLCGCAAPAAYLTPDTSHLIPFTAQSRTVIAPAPASAILLPPQANVSWNASADDSVAGYVVYYGPAPFSFTNAIAVGTNLTVTVGALDYWGIYYFAVTAMDTNGVESDFSDEVPFLVPKVLELQFGDVPGDFVQASTDFVNWSPRAATRVGNAWHVVIDPSVPKEFYRSGATAP
jgi:hypothetical protein